ncbi:MAG: cation diffusion facilitator family transporter [Acutalibacteraceae bacterium]|nr:cation diffusion facilitator family transporter [Acutalibacteraceae bacterium]
MISAFLVRLFIKNHEDVKDNRVRQSYGTLGSVVGIICNLILCALKITVGFITGSISVAADGLNNLSDMGSSIVTMIGFKMAGKPADNDHPFGHGRIEYMSAFIVAVLILLVGFELLKTSITALIKGEISPEYSVTAALILFVSVLIKLWMFFFNRKLGKKICSEALTATAQDSLNDCIATTVILISVGISMLFTLPFNLDAVMGILVSIFILYSGISSAKNTLNDILGTPPEKELIENIEATIMSFKEFIGIHDLIVHNYGPGRQFASVHVEVPQNSNIVKCHEQIDLCEKLLYEKLDISVVIHMDPIDTENETVTETRLKLAESLKIIDNSLTMHDFRMTPISDQRTNLIFDVVVPSSVKLSHKELDEKIKGLAKLINPTFMCVITFDNDFTGK